MITNLDITDFNYPEYNKIKMVKGDIRDINFAEKAMKDIDIVVQCAAALPLYSKKDIFSIDVEGTKNVLEIATKNNVKRVIQISSTAVYGIPNHHPIFEEDKLDGVGPYGEAKILAEKVCMEYREKGMCIPIIRPKSFIGPERLGVFALFYDWAKDGKGFPMIGKWQK
jgi:nucleoside-diphosphate-sugar epimerase